VFCAVLLAIFVWAQKHSEVSLLPHGPFTVNAIETAGGNSKVISQLMFSKYVLPFELTSVLLLAGIVGAVAIAKRNLSQKEKKR